ncbi:hypothetical protein BRI6_2858 [plant metagenome]|uniref:Uncharacterized protein n=1 Tax=plant metagenome TaxID=1297885 RepID=A0A484UHF2_9ZZZZ
MGYKKCFLAGDQFFARLYYRAFCNLDAVTSAGPSLQPGPRADAHAACQLDSHAKMREISQHDIVIDG